MELKTILVFSVLAVVMLLSATQLSQSFTQEVNENEEKIEGNKDLQLEAREIQNDFRNKTLNLLDNIAERLDTLEEKIILPLTPTN